jgi:trypsin
LEFFYLFLCFHVFNFFSDPGGSPCQYDEGSPLVQELVDPDTSEKIPTAVGIFSKTKICAYGTPEAPGIYTRLSEFYSWLLATAGQQPVRSQGTL